MCVGDPYFGATSREVTVQQIIQIYFQIGDSSAKISQLYLQIGDSSARGNRLLQLPGVQPGNLATCKFFSYFFYLVATFKMFFCNL